MLPRLISQGKQPLPQPKSPHEVYQNIMDQLEHIRLAPGAFMYLLPIQNVLALRGDGDARGTFSSSVELIRVIRQKFGGFFCIAVAAYPEGHPSQSKQDYWQEIAYLQEKVSAGAYFVITQLC